MNLLCLWLSRFEHYEIKQTKIKSYSNILYSLIMSNVTLFYGFKIGIPELRIICSSSEFKEDMLALHQAGFSTTG